MSDYNATQTEYREKCKARIKRQLEISKFEFRIIMMVKVNKILKFLVGENGKHNNFKKAVALVPISLALR